MSRILYHKRQLATTFLILLMASCAVDFENPNSPSGDAVLTTREGIIGLAIGLQDYYATSALGNIVLTPGTTTREVAINTTFANLVELEAGGTNLSNTGNVAGLWSSLFRVIEMSEELISNAPKAPLDPGTRSGIVALAYFYKAAALGFLVQSYEKAPIIADQSGKAVFFTRSEVLNEAIRLIDLGLQTVQTIPISTEFQSKVQGTGFRLENSLNAYRARYSLLAGRYSEAITYANAVVTASTSVFNYTDLSRNPIYQSVFVSNSYAPQDSFGTALTEPGDARIAFFLIPNSAVSRPNSYPIETLAGFFTTPTQSIPVFLPGEMALIRAEAYVQTNDLGNAVAEIDAIRTKTRAQDPFGVGASLGAYTGLLTAPALLTEIYRQRCAELYLTGMRFEDSRRLGRPGPPDLTERNRNFYPYPQLERVNNPNTPPDPAI